MGPVRPGLQRVEREPQVVDRARERGQVVDDVDGLVDRDLLRHVVVDEREAVAAEVLDVLERRDLEVVEADNALSLLEERLAEVRAEKPGATGDERGRHRGDATRRWRAHGALLTKFSRPCETRVRGIVPPDFCC